MLLAWLVNMATSPQSLAQEHARDGASTLRIEELLEYLLTLIFLLLAFPSVAGKFATDSTNNFNPKDNDSRCNEER